MLKRHAILKAHVDRHYTNASCKAARNYFLKLGSDIVAY